MLNPSDFQLAHILELHIKHQDAKVYPLAHILDQLKGREPVPTQEQNGVNATFGSLHVAALLLYGTRAEVEYFAKLGRFRDVELSAYIYAWNNTFRYGDKMVQILSEDNEEVRQIIVATYDWLVA